MGKFLNKIKKDKKNLFQADFDVLLALTAEFAERESRLKSERTVVAKQREQFLRLLSAHSELLTAELNDMGTLSRRFEGFQFLLILIFYFLFRICRQVGAVQCSWRRSTHKAGHG